MNSDISYIIIIVINYTHQKEKLKDRLIVEIK
jgi:hypothetical protein